MTSNFSLQPDAGRQGTIFCVDCRDYMFEVNEDDEKNRTHMVIALQAIRNEMNLICCSADLRYMVGVIFFNTAKTNIQSQNLDNIFVYRNMRDYNENGFIKSLDANAVKQIDGLIKDDKERKEFFEKTLGGSGLSDYSELLWLIQRSFRHDVNAKKKTVFVFSRNQFLDEYENDTMVKIRSEIKNVKADGIQITHMLLGEEDIGDRWRSLGVVTEVFNSSEKLATGIKRRNIARRPSTTLSMHFGNNINLAVSVFYLIAEQKRETGVYLNEETNKLVQCKTRIVKQPTITEKMSILRITGDDNEDGDPSTVRETVDPNKIKRTLRVGGTNIELSKDEYDKMKRIDNPGVYIIGFKPMKFLKTSHQMGPTQFLWPNEKLVNGSAVMYRALHSRCLARDVFILARFVLKKSTMPKLVALIPQRKGDPESKVTDVEDYFYEGFHVIQLPFAEDKRNLQSKLEGDWPEPNTEQVNAAEAFIEKLTIPYYPEAFSNPTLQKHYWVLEGLAVENNDYEENHEFDQIKPYFEKTDRAKEEAEALAAILL